ncbi:tetratricopeptide repeat protein [Streptomyces sp. NRRL F-5123]|uniref:tetratricopeptide repeat protein n=1 Tax=Streptomyces sp. NRRL F-5123 TaxID=1463856 RepID=UPI0004E1215E|nr:ATP-binding protein [Streptomyces sp. NRRL F-5123]
MPESRIALRETDRAAAERLLARVAAELGAADTAPQVRAARERFDEITGAAAGEYAAYRRALEAGPAGHPAPRGAAGAGGRTAGGVATGVAALTAFGVDVGQGLSLGAALATGAAVGAAGVAALGTAAARGRAARRAASADERTAPGGAEQLRLLWLAALERRGIRPFLEAEAEAAAAAPTGTPTGSPTSASTPSPRGAEDRPAPSTKGTGRSGLPEQPSPPSAAEDGGGGPTSPEPAAGRHPAAKKSTPLVQLVRTATDLPKGRRPGGPGADRSAAARTRAVLDGSFGQLPVVDGPFAGREEDLAFITRAVQHSRAQVAVQPTVVVLHGDPGSGRTSLAVRAARQLKDQFRGACVVDLRGADESRTALPTRDALLHLLNRLGAPREQLLFRDRQDRQDNQQHLRRLSEQYQQHLTGVPVVIVLDDATDAAQVQALVPERSESLVLVTAREPLVLDLPEARVHHRVVGPLSPAGTHALLRGLAEPAGLEAPGATQAERIGALCAGLPLALRIAGAALADHQGYDQLAGDIEMFGPQPAVDRILALRYHDQPEPNRRLLRRLALAGRSSFGAAAAAALLATDDQEAGRRLAELAAAGLVDHVRGSRYRPHDLVRAFAAARLLDEEDPAERAAAHERLIISYADLANTVVRLVEGKTSTRAGRFGQYGFASLEAALRWLDEESSFITAALRETEGVDRAAVQSLLGALCDYCLLRGDLYRLGEISELAQAQQARTSRDGQDEDRSVLVRSVQWRTGIAARQLGELDRAKSTLSTVVDLYFEAQHPAGAARALDSLGITLHHQGNLREAEVKLREALAIQQTPELEEDRAWTMHALAAVLRDMGQLAGALELLHESLELHRANESVQGQAWAHLQLGQVYLLLGRLDRGERELRAAGQAYAQARDPRGTAWTTTQLARARLLRGEAREASADLDAAVQRHRASEDARGEAWSLYYLGLALEENGSTDAALRTLERSRTMFSRMRDVYGLACARHNSARVTRDQRAARTGNLRNSGFARQLLQDARQDFRRIGVEHGEAWCCVELAVIDAGNERLVEALTLLEEAQGLFASVGDRRGRDWAVFLRATVLPLLSPEGTQQALADLHGLAAREPYQGRDLDMDGYAAAYALLLERGSISPGDPWEAWRLTMTPGRAARMIMAVPT